MTDQNRIYTIDEIKEICRPIFHSRDFIYQVYLFGSYARSEATGASDVDFMIVLNRPVGWALYGLYDDLSEPLNKRVDIITEDESKQFHYGNFQKDKVLIYEQEYENHV